MKGTGETETDNTETDKLETDKLETAMTEPFSESVLQIGSPNPLNGVLVTPNESTQRPCVVILNSGLLHHVGSCGFSVKLARELARRGHPSFRFDFSGIGDSPPRAVSADYMERMEQEVIEVLDHLQGRLNTSQFVLYGLCSGAFTSLACAAKDARVVAVAQIAPQSFRTLRWYMNHYLPKLALPVKIIRRLLRVFAKESPHGQEEGQEELFEQLADTDIELPDREGLAHQYRALIERRVPLFTLSTRGELETYNYLGQMEDMLPNVVFGDLLEEHLYADTRHIITEPDDQQEIVNLLVQWIGCLPDTAASGA